MKKIKQMANPRVGDAGDSVVFQITAIDGSEEEYDIPSSEIPYALEFFVQIADFMARHRTGGKAKAFGRDADYASLPFTHLGFAETSRPNRAALLFGNYDYALGFELDQRQVDALAEGVRVASQELRNRTKSSRKTRH